MPDGEADDASNAIQLLVFSGWPIDLSVRNSGVVQIMDSEESGGQDFATTPGWWGKGRDLFVHVAPRNQVK